MLLITLSNVMIQSTPLFMTLAPNSKWVSLVLGLEPCRHGSGHNLHNKAIHVIDEPFNPMGNNIIFP